MRGLLGFRPIGARIIRPLTEFIAAEAWSGILLLVCGALALVLSNSAYRFDYSSFWQAPVHLEFGSFRSTYSLLHWINDGLMAVFFLTVGLEIKRELIVGELSGIRQAMLPICAALGGMSVPALIYVAFNFGKQGVNGWAIPVATDIALSLGVMALLGKRCPISLKLFLAALAIVDDIGAVVVIALFYSRDLDMSMLIGAASVLGLLFLLNRMGTRNLLVYLALGALLWGFVGASGLHSTIAGVLLAITIPARVKLRPNEFTEVVEGAVAEFRREEHQSKGALLTEDQQGSIQAVERACRQVQMPAQRLESHLHPWVSYGIVPLFVLGNSGVTLSHELRDNFRPLVALGIGLGLLIGKPLGILMFSYLAVRLKAADLPPSVGWRQLSGAAMLGGVGLTMSLFITRLAFSDTSFIETARITILAASVAAGVGGLALIYFADRSGRPEPPARPVRTV